MPARQRLRALDRVLADRPNKVSADFSEALRSLCRLRDEQTAGPRLDQVNSVISAVMAGSYPEDGVPWEELEAGRRLLAGTLQSG